MNHTLASRINQYLSFAQEELFPFLRQYSPLTPQLEKFIHVIECLQIECFIPPSTSLGRKQHDRLAFARAFFAKTVLNLPTTNALIERLTADTALARLCGFSIHHRLPHKSSFSRAFCEFTDYGLSTQAHQYLVNNYLSDQLIGHLSHDSTAIHAREKLPKQVKAYPPAKKYPRGRPKANERRPSKKEPVIVRQQKQTHSEMLKAIPRACNKGTKKDSQGNKYSWKGYKLHGATADGDIPICAYLTSASIHDSQMLMPLMLEATKRIDYCYDLADAAYCSPILRQASRKLGHVPLIDHNPRRGPKIKFDPCESQRYKARSSAERLNAYLKDHYGGRQIYVKGAAKVMSHLMFGMATIAAVQILRLIQ